MTAKDVSPPSPTLNPGDIVTYENDGQPLVAVVIDRRKDKFLLLNQRGRETEMTPDRLYSLNARVPAEINTTPTRAGYLDKLSQETEASFKVA